MNKKSNLNYNSSRKDIPSARISLYQKDANTKSWNNSKINARQRVFSPPMGNFMATGKVKNIKSKEMP